MIEIQPLQHQEYRYIKIKIISLGVHAGKEMNDLGFISEDDRYTITSENEISEKELQLYCFDAGIVYVVIDFRDSSLLYLEKVIEILAKTKVSILSIVQNSMGNEELTERIGRYTSLMELDRQQKIHDLTEAVTILYFLMYDRIEAVRVQDEAFSSKTTLESFFERHLQLYLYAEVNAHSLTQMIMEDEKEREKFGISQQCWLGFPKVEGKDFGGESISELIGVIEKTVPEDTTIYMYSKNNDKKSLLQTDRVIIAIGI